jgi:hypothetical protein
MSECRGVNETHIQLSDGMNGIDTQPCYPKNIGPSIGTTPWLFVCMLALMVTATVCAAGIARAHGVQQCTSNNGLGPLPSSRARRDENGTLFLSIAASRAAGDPGWVGARYTCSNVQPTSFVLLLWDIGTPAGNTCTLMTLSRTQIDWKSSFWGVTRCGRAELF